MRPEVTHKLLAINQEFYQTFALQFSQTRQRLQPGVSAILKRLPPQAAVLDLGCGNGWLAHELFSQGWNGNYTGIDASPGLLEIASRRASRPGETGAAPASAARSSFILADLASPDWVLALTQQQADTGGRPDFEVILCFAVLHHLPGQALRLQVLQNARRFQEGIRGARLWLSVWQFLNSPSWQERIQPWQAAGLEQSQVDPGDYLLDWRHGGPGLRYVHHFQADELASLASQSGYQIEESFHADGKNGRLGLYQVWLAV